MKESVKIIPAKKQVVIRIFRKQPLHVSSMQADVHFELRSLCDIPILIFKLNESGEILAVPVNFKKMGVWPDLQNLPVVLQFFDLDADMIFFEKQLLLNAEDTKAVLENRFEQIRMKSKQIDAIVDFIYSDYIGFAQLAESL